MNVSRVTFDRVNQFSDTDIAYALGNDALKPFYRYTPNLEGIKEALQNRQFSAKNRTILVEELTKQYDQLTTSKALQENLAALANDKTFVVTTAHQPSLLTGPLYVIYKIIGVINLAERLNKEFPDHHIVPIYWLGAEDHDFEEVNHLNLFGKTITWDDKQGGAVGQYSINSLDETLKEVEVILGDSERAQSLNKLIRRVYESSTTYANFTFRLIHALFDEYGLVVLDANRKAFKALMKPIFEDDILTHRSRELVQATAERLTEAGFKNQAYPRAINLFYLLPNDRVRIVETEAGYRALDTDIEWTENELLKELADYPENFSPNVILRPLFQETVLPNLAYIGGGGELAYWLERKTQFEAYEIPFPVLIRRNSVLWLDKRHTEKLEKFGFDRTEIFEDTETLIKKFVHQNTEAELQFEGEKQAFSPIFEQVAQKVEAIDPTLQKAVKAQEAQLLNALDKLQKRLVKRQKQQYETTVKQIRKWKDKLFPNNGLQERHDNFLDFQFRYGKTFFDILKTELNPLDKHFLIIDDD